MLDEKPMLKFGFNDAKSSYMECTENEQTTVMMNYFYLKKQLLIFYILFKVLAFSGEGFVNNFGSVCNNNREKSNWGKKKISKN